MTSIETARSTLDARLVLVVGGLALVIGGTVLLLQTSSTQDAVRGLMRDPRIRIAGRQAIGLMACTILESLLAEVRKLAMPPLET